MQNLLMPVSLKASGQPVSDTLGRHRHRHPLALRSFFSASPVSIIVHLLSYLTGISGLAYFSLIVTIHFHFIYVKGYST